MVCVFIISIIILDTGVTVPTVGLSQVVKDRVWSHRVLGGFSVPVSEVVKTGVGVIG